VNLQGWFGQGVSRRRTGQKLFDKNKICLREGARLLVVITEAINVIGKFTEVVWSPRGGCLEEVVEEVVILAITHNSCFLLAPHIPEKGEVVKLVVGEGGRG
jgi:hypothetical protein